MPIKEIKSQCQTFSESRSKLTQIVEGAIPLLQLHVNAMEPSF